MASKSVLFDSTDMKGSGVQASCTMERLNSGHSGSAECQSQGSGEETSLIFCKNESVQAAEGFGSTCGTRVFGEITPYVGMPSDECRRYMLEEYVGGVHVELTCAP